MVDRTVLSLTQFQLLHQIIMAYPEGLNISRFDPDANELAAYGYVKRHIEGWKPTEAGMYHVMPKTLRVA